MIYWLKLIFLPWLVLRQERRAHWQSIEQWRQMLYEADPHYFDRKQLEMMMASPRMNCAITGIEAPR